MKRAIVAVLVLMSIGAAVHPDAERLKRENERLKADLAQLRTDFDILQGLRTRLEGEVRQLREENARLKPPTTAPAQKK